MSCQSSTRNPNSVGMYGLNPLLLFVDDDELIYTNIINLEVTLPLCYVLWQNCWIDFNEIYYEDALILKEG